jgi:phosphoribosylformimino-5-aminoimidazole carboxamide ribotide isomerase
MRLYPAIDLIGGRVVRLLQGDFDKQTNYPLDPIDLAKSYEDQGAKWLHVVDLDGAKGDAQASLANIRLIGKIVQQTSLRIQTGGGVRDESGVHRRLEAGVARVVIGSLAIRAPELVKLWKERFGAEQLTLAMDARADGEGVFRVHVAGWQEAAEAELFATLQDFHNAGFVHALITDIAQDGMLAGPNLGLYKALKAKMPKLRIQASGGVSSLADLASLSGDQIDGVVIGKALLEGRFTLLEAVNQTGSA